MSQNLPSRLFKYRPPGDLTILEHLTVRFSPPSEFNDAFEFLPSVENFDSEYWLSYAGKILEVDLAFKFAEMGVGGRKRPFSSLDAFKKHVLAELFSNSEAAKSRIINSVIKTKSGGELGVFCLSGVSPDSPDANLLWGHYAQNHEGFVIEFDGTHPFIAGHSVQEDGPMTGGWIDYDSHERPAWNENTPVREFMFRKAPSWAYEKEYRLLRMLNSSSLGMGTDSRGLRTLAQIPSGAIVSVTFGVRTPKEEKRKIIAALGCSQLSGVPILQARFSDRHYRLDVEKFDPSKHA